MKKLIILLCITLSFTSVSFFKLGKAEFTLFHALAILTTFSLLFNALLKGNFVMQKPRFFFMAFIYLAAVNLYYLDSIKATSFVYSLFILVEALLLFNCVKMLSTEDIKKIAKIITLLYFINILIASVFIWLHITPTGLLAQIFKIYVFAGRIRPYGFSDEPSYASLILVFTLFVLFKCDQFKYRSSELKWYVLAVLTIFLTGSSYGLLMLIMLLTYFILKSNVIILQAGKVLKSKVLSWWQIMSILLVVLVPTVIVLKNVDLNNNKSVRRLVDLYQSINISDDEVGKTIKHIAYVDGSASMRLVPTVLLVEDFGRSELKYVLFGRGAGQSVPFFSRFYEGDVTILGFLPSFVYNYGLLGTLIFFLFFMSIFPKKRWLLWVLFILFTFNADFNTQIFLFILFCIMCARQIENNSLTAIDLKYVAH